MELEYRVAAEGPDRTARRVVRDIWVSCRPNQSTALASASLRLRRSTRNSWAILEAGRRSVRDQRGDPLGHFAHRDDGLDRPALGIDGGNGSDGGVGDVDRLAVGGERHP